MDPPEKTNQQDAKANFEREEMQTWFVDSADDFSEKNKYLASAFFDSGKQSGKSAQTKENGQADHQPQKRPNECRKESHVTLTVVWSRESLA